MKLALIRQRYTPFGGAERFVERALDALLAQGVEVSLLTRSWAGAAPRADFRQVICDPAYSRLFGGRAARDRSFAQAVQAELARGAYDLSQSHERIPGCTVFRAGDGVHAAWLDHRSAILSPWQRLGQGLAPYHRYVLASERAMFAHPALRAVICNSRMVADEVAAYYDVPPDRLRVIYNGLDLERFHPGLAAEQRAPTRAGLGIAEGVPVLLYVGNGFERKGVPQLLDAFARQPERAAHLIVVGGDRKLKAAQARAARLGIAPRVHFTGPVPDVRPYYAAADGFVLPTLYDPCPNAALEALACGLPLVTSPACGAKEWISPGLTGWVAPPTDPDALADALHRLIGLAGQTAPRQAARQAVAHLDLGAMAERLLALYRELLDR